MQGILVREIGRFERGELPVPIPGPGEALVEVAVSGLCRTDLKLIEVGHRDLVLPRVPGEEVVGIVRAFGPAGADDGAAVSVPDGARGDPPAAASIAGRDTASVAAPIAAGDPPAVAAPIAVGDRVYVYPGVSCGECPPCRRDAGNLCRRMSIMGFHRDGGFADFVVAPRQSLIRVPEGLSDEDAVFAEPLSCCLNALELGRVVEGDTLGVWGAGPAGTLLARAGRLRGARVHIVEPDARRRARAAGGGVEVSDAPPPDGSLDIAIVAVGSGLAYLEALVALGPRGRLVAFSGISPAEAMAAAPSLNELHYHEQTIVGAYGCSFRHGTAALELLASGRLPVTDLISHRLPLADLAEGLRIVKQRDGMKVHLYPGDLCPATSTPAASTPARLHPGTTPPR